MIVYFVMLTFVCLQAMWSIFLPKEMYRLRYGISFVGYGTMCLFIGLRDHVGADWDSYNVIFQRIAGSSLFESFLLVEPLYVICNRMAQIAGGDIHLVNLICAAILLGSLFNFARMVGLDSNLLLFISTPYLLFVVGMGYTRQSVAVGLSLNAIGYLRFHKYKIFYLLAGLATLFHYSAIFIILLWWVNTRKRAAVVAAALVAISPLLFLVFSSARYVHYVDNSADMQSSGVWSRVLLVSLGLFLIFLQRSRWAGESELRKVVAKSAIALIFLILLGLFLSTFADRLCLYLFFVYILGIGGMIRFAKMPMRYISIGFVVCITYAVFIAWFGFSAYAPAAWFPYRLALYGAT